MYKNEEPLLTKNSSTHDNVNKEIPLIGISYAHDDADEEPRIAVQELYKLVDKLYDEFGKGRILFDKNSCFESMFDGYLGKT